MEQKGDCESCHSFREDGTYAGLPDTASCAECHSEAMGSDPEEIRFVEEYVKQDREVEWHVYSKQPDCVFFSHAAHVTKGGMDCATCHGDIGTSESSRPYYVNRITGYSRDIWGSNISGIQWYDWSALTKAHAGEGSGEGEGHGGDKSAFTMRSMKMGDCAACHLHMKGVEREGCFVCHK